MFKKSVLPALLVVSFFAFGLGTSRADEVNFVATTSGGFTAETPLGLTYNPGGFNVITAPIGFAALTDLGSLSLSLADASYFGHGFALQVTFSVPTGIPSGPTATFTAIVLGQVTSTTTGGVQVIFTNPLQSFTYSDSGGNGSFTLLVNGVSVDKGQSSTITGSILDARYTPAAVPEPSSLLLLGTGLVGLARIRHSSTRKKSD